MVVAHPDRLQLVGWFLHQNVSLYAFLKTHARHTSTHIPFHCPPHPTRHATLSATRTATRRAAATTAAVAAAAQARARYEEAVAAAAAAAAAHEARQLALLPSPGSSPELRELEQAAQEAHAAALHASKSSAALHPRSYPVAAMPHSKSAAANLGSPPSADAALARASAPPGALSPRANGAGGSAPVDVRDGRAGRNSSPVEDGLKQLGTSVASAMGLWGVVDSVSSSSEGLRNLVQGAWARTQQQGRSRAKAEAGGGGRAGGGKGRGGGAAAGSPPPPAAAAAGMASGAASGAAPPTAAAAGPGGPGPPAADQHRHRQSASFSACLDPQGYTLIEDYARAPPPAPAPPPPRPRSPPPPTPARPAPRRRAPPPPSRTSPHPGQPAGLEWLRQTPLGGGISALGQLGQHAAGLVNNAGGLLFPIPGPEPDTVADGDEPGDEACSEVYEHERVQPFRGWGHSWPGHFLPSDRVGHWGDRYGRPGGPTSMLFEKVVPRLPRGWEWAEDEWHVDMTGEEEDGVDAEGWSYSMDFRWVGCGGWSLDFQSVFCGFCRGRGSREMCAAWQG